MAFFDKIKQIVSGKTDIERTQERIANQQIRGKAMSAQLREREVQAVKYAQASERLKYQQKLKSLKNPRSTFGGFNVVAPEFRNYGSVTSSPRLIKNRTINKTIGKGKKRRKVKRIIRTAPSYNTPNIIQSSKYNVLGF